MEFFHGKVTELCRSLHPPGADSRNHTSQPNYNGQCEKKLYGGATCPLWLVSLWCTIWRGVGLFDLISTMWLTSGEQVRMGDRSLTTLKSDTPTPHTHITFFVTQSSKIPELMDGVREGGEKGQLKGKNHPREHHPREHLTL